VLLEPLLIDRELMTGCDLFMAADLQLVQMGQVTFGAYMGQKMRGVAKGWLLGTNAAVQQVRGHWERLLWTGLTSARKQQVKQKQRSASFKNQRTTKEQFPSFVPGEVRREYG